MNTHRPGDTGDEVGLLQRQLVHAGFDVPVTHIYDAATEHAVKAFQASVGLVVDGIAGLKTLAALAIGQREPKHLCDVDLLGAAAALDVDVACVRAINEIESCGHGFLADGRAAILFERHIFWERLRTHGIDPEPLTLCHPDIISQTRGGYAGGMAEYARLEKAEAIHAGAAWESASWGAFQVMGEHWQRLGYESVDEFVSCMQTGEREQLDAFVRFVKSDRHLMAALKSRNWEAFAQGYNGRVFRANLYDVKLARAYDRYAAIPTATR